MTKSQIIELVKNPALVLEKDVLFLHELSSKYPWCQAVHLLYTKGLHTSKNINYLESLKYTAALTSDRKQLYQQIMQAALRKKIEAFEEIQLIEEAKETIIPIAKEKEISEIQTDRIVTSREEIENILDQKLKFIFPKKEEISSEQEVDTDTKTEEKEKTSGLENTSKASDDYSELEKQILWEAVNASIQVDVSNKIEDLPELEHAKNSAVLDSELNKYKDEQAEIDFKSRQSFFTWLTPTNQSNEIDNVSEKTAKSNITEDLIDKFLKTDPKITPSKTEFYTPGNMAKLSITDNEDFVSETLAVIYIKQGYYPKAVRVFEKLSLKFPEKSTYFAARIKELESLQKNNKK